MFDFKPLGEKIMHILKVEPEIRNYSILCTRNQYHDQIPPYDALSYC